MTNKNSRRVDPKVYDKNYYLSHCCGFQEFKRSYGSEEFERLHELFKDIKIKKNMNILDVGCGRGDAAFYFARRGANVVGIDYARAGILLAKKALVKQKNLKGTVDFNTMDAKKLKFKNNSFDMVVCIDVFEHLYPEELDIAAAEMHRVLKPKGVLFVQTEPNKIYLDFTHKFYIYPMSQLLIAVNKLITGKAFPGLPKDPRNDVHKVQHVNEPTYFYLKSLFRKHHFEGEISQNISLLKEVMSWKDWLYNVIVLWYPLSLLYPFILLFSYNYICIMKARK